MRRNRDVAWSLAILIAVACTSALTRPTAPAPKPSATRCAFTDPSPSPTPATSEFAVQARKGLLLTGRVYDKTLQLQLYRDQFLLSADSLLVRETLSHGRYDVKDDLLILTPTSGRRIIYVLRDPVGPVILSWSEGAGGRPRHQRAAPQRYQAVEPALVLC